MQQLQLAWFERGQPADDRGAMDVQFRSSMYYALCHSREKRDYMTIQMEEMTISIKPIFIDFMSKISGPAGEQSRYLHWRLSAWAHPHFCSSWMAGHLIASIL